MDPNSVRGLINQLLYTIQFPTDLTDAGTVEVVADSIRTQRNFRHSPLEYMAAIAIVLREGHLPPQTLAALPYPEGEILDWLGRLGDRLSPGFRGPAGNRETGS